MTDYQALSGGLNIMSDKVCSFFGHRKIKITEELKQKLIETIESLIINKNVSIFLFGSRSEFDDLCHLIVTKLKEKYPHIIRKCYTCKSETCTLESEREHWGFYYSPIEQKPIPIPRVEEEVTHKTKFTAGRAGYVERNQAMINDSDYCIFYYDENYKPEMRKRSKRDLTHYQPKSGTKLAYNYAKQKKKFIINLIP